MPRHGQPLYDVDAGGIFGARRAQELAPGGHALEQRLHLDARAGRQRGGPLLHQHAIVDDSPPAVAPTHPTFDREPRDARDRGQRFAAKTERFDRFDGAIHQQAFGQLGGGVALQRKGDVVGSHPAAVVGHLDRRQPAFAQRHGDARGTRVDGVFDQLLERAGRSFDHFTGSDAVDQMLGKAPY
jgi:hypothetical protein